MLQVRRLVIIVACVVLTVAFSLTAFADAPGKVVSLNGPIPLNTELEVTMIEVDVKNAPADINAELSATLSVSGNVAVPYSALCPKCNSASYVNTTKKVLKSMYETDYCLHGADGAHDKVYNYEITELNRCSNCKYEEVLNTDIQVLVTHCYDSH